MINWRKIEIQKINKNAVFRDSENTFRKSGPKKGSVEGHLFKQVFFRCTMHPEKEIRRCHCAQKSGEIVYRAHKVCVTVKVFVFGIFRTTYNESGSDKNIYQRLKEKG